ncbi:hypothetical protein BC834DRAFT_254106 [Gloeopeniophorella convolvens]|nr:hypothetical protein BC834DRAFT_254106 [Gloeopeniophorella convolvens]
MAGYSRSASPISPPSLLRSSSSSMADTLESESPSFPHTPPRGRSRYPSNLSNGTLRVPLHHRGTSNTYERLEDLLKEAGYKETRVFTPETERYRERDESHAEASESISRKRGGVGAVVGFLAGLVQGHAEERDAVPNPRLSDHETQTVPPSPLSRSRDVTTSGSRPPRAPPSPVRGGQGHPHTSRGVPYPGQQPDSDPSPARAYLRHIASAPNINRRRMLKGYASSPTADRSVVGLNENVYPRHSLQPPMPNTWLETVARAVLDFPGAYMGGKGSPRSRRQSPQQTRTGFSSQPTSRSSTVRGHGTMAWRRPPIMRSDATNATQSRTTASRYVGSDSLRPPDVLAMRPQAFPGQVVKMNVVCRSAPASRSSSIAGRRSDSGSLASATLGKFSGENARGKGKAPQSKARTSRTKTRRYLADSGPSLTGRVEGHSSGLEEDNYDLNSSSEDEDEGELDLSRLLVHPRRQQSIKSLRRHLERASHVRADDGPRNSGDAWAWNGGDESAAPSSSRGRIRRGSVNDGDWGSPITPTRGHDGGGLPQRRAIPPSWTQRNSRQAGKS